MADEKKKKRGRPRLSTTWTAKLLNDRAREYFDKCDARQRKAIVMGVGVVEVDDPAPYTVEGLCNYLSITTMTFRNWRKKDDALGEKAKLLNQIITENRITGALDGKQNPSFARFMMTNNNADEYRDKVEVEASVSESARSIFETWVDTWSIKKSPNN